MFNTQRMYHHQGTNEFASIVNANATQGFNLRELPKFAGAAFVCF
jgi:hypothetical protein